MLMPLRLAMTERVDFARITAGILLFIIFTGKMLYDIILDPWMKTSEKSAAVDLLRMLGVVLVIALVVGIVIFFIGLLAYSYFQDGALNLRKIE